MKVQKITKTTFIGEGGFTFMDEPVADTITIEKTKTGYIAKYLVQDDDYENPSEWADDNLFLVAYHREFELRSELITRDQCSDLVRYLYGERDFDKERLQFVKDFSKKYYHFGLEAYIHSGIRLAIRHEGNFPDRRWDVSYVGAIFVAKEEWKEIDEAKKVALGLIESWNYALSGEVYGVVCEYYDNNKKQIEEDACWGFYGFDNALEELKEMKGD